MFFKPKLLNYVRRLCNKTDMNLSLDLAANQ